MDSTDILSLASQLRLPPVVMRPLAEAAALPELPIAELTDPDAAPKAWQVIAERLGPWQADDGMSHLAVMLAAAAETEERYRREGIPAEIFDATMGCFARFLRETHERTGRWAFDRAFWTYRQTSGVLFRLGVLEFEYRRAGAGPLPDGLAPDDPVLSVHIPSDAALRRGALDDSYAMARRFFAGTSRRRFGAPKAFLCGSWLLAPALKELLPEGSHIRCFASDYRLFAVEEENTEFYEWLFGGHAPVEALPETTSLQRAVKERLARGGRIGSARGVLLEREQID